MADNQSRNATAIEPILGEDLQPNFENLAAQRKLLQDFCRFHSASLQAFAADESDAPVFKLFPHETRSGLRHITSSATCYASLDTCSSMYWQDKKAIAALKARGEEFAKAAIEWDVVNWKSDKAAQIYCSCRGLPYVVSKLKRWHSNIDIHLSRIAVQLFAAPERFGIGEAYHEVPGEKNGVTSAASQIKSTEEASSKLAFEISVTGEEKRNWYPPNAYHTFWILRLLEELETQFSSDKGCLNSESFKFLRNRRDGMRLWAQKQLGIQVALHSADSSKLDSDQLGWSLAILISQPKLYRSDLAQQDLIRQAFHCLFDTQESVGTWRHYEPLFHYPGSGNAYCYVFETFAALITECLKPDASFARNTLKRYFHRLIALWRYAISTKTQLNAKEPKTPISYAWQSRHRNEDDLESWATASVFQYTQALRQVVGLWTKEEALSSLNHKQARLQQLEAREELVKRAKSWTTDDLGDQLTAMFVNPLVAQTPDILPDPDQPIFDENAARSAIFFGPPGTSKTTLVTTLADSIGWKYIELHPSHFVSEGLPNVQNTADQIFRKLMELDRAVILFDEIDELVRAREIEKDQFGRFLTTSMLPRIAQLWKAGKVMYFVATNHIEFFDPAVVRSERFDAIILVSPPSFEAKKKKITDIFEKRYGTKVSFDEALTREVVNAEMPKSKCSKMSDEKQENASDNNVSPLAKFALLRWDELSEAAMQIREVICGRLIISRLDLESAMSKMKARSLKDYCRLISDQRHYERFDASLDSTWRVANPEVLDLPEEPEYPFEKRPDGIFVKAPLGGIDRIAISGFRALKSAGIGEVRFEKLVTRKEKFQSNVRRKGNRRRNRK